MAPNKLIVIRIKLAMELVIKGADVCITKCKLWPFQWEIIICDIRKSVSISNLSLRDSNLYKMALFPFKA